MKNIRPAHIMQLLFVLSSSALLLGGCNEENLFGISKDDNGEHISFCVTPTFFTRAVAVNSANDLVINQIPVNIVAYEHKVPWNNPSTSPTIYQKAALTGSGDRDIVWTCEPKMKWSVGNYLSFFASAGDGITLDELSLSNVPSYTVTAGNGDAMIATPALDKVKGRVDLTLNHILSRVGFSVKLRDNSPEGTTVKISGISISGWAGANAIKTGNYVYDSSTSRFYWNTFSSYTADESVSFKTNGRTLTTSDFTDVCISDGYCYFIPQDLSTTGDLKIDLSYNITQVDGSLSSVILSIPFNPKTKWEEGKPYNYEVTLDTQARNLTVSLGNNYQTDETGIDAHEDMQPIYLSAIQGIAKVTLPGNDAWATLEVPDGEASTTVYSKLNNHEIYVSFTGSTDMKERQLNVHFADNAPINQSLFTTRTTSVSVFYFKGAIGIEEAKVMGNASADEKTEIPFKQSTPSYIGAFGGWMEVDLSGRGTAHYYSKGLIMENFEEYAIDNFRRDMISGEGLMFWDGMTLWSSSPNSESDGLKNTNLIEPKNSNVIPYLDSRFNANAAKYCKSKGEGWYLPSPNQMRTVAEYGKSIPEATYWTSMAISTSNAATVSKTAFGETIDMDFGTSFGEKKKIRCVKDVAIQNQTINEPIDTGTGKIYLDDNTAKKDANWNYVGNKACNSSDDTHISGDSWRLATIDEYLYLASINDLLPTNKKMETTYRYFGKGKIANTKDAFALSFTSFGPPLSYSIKDISDGRETGTYRCVKDVP